MKLAFQVFGVILLVIVLAYGLGFAMTGGDLAIYSFWAPKQANAERRVFEHTQSYVEGKIEFIAKSEREYKEATSEQEKDALRTLILDEASTIDNSLLPASEQNFISQLKGE